MRVIAATKEDFAWMEARLGPVLTSNARAIKAVDAAGRIRGMVAYDNWTEVAVQSHMVVDSPVVWRSLLGPAFSYPFEECGKALLLGIIPLHNHKSIALTRHLGFREAYRIRDGWAPGDDLVVFEMRKHECPWLGTQKRRAAA